MSKLGDVGSGIVDFATVCAVGCVTASVGVLVLFNIARSLPDDPIWPELRCAVGIEFQGDDKCFDKKLSEGLSKMEKAFQQEMQERQKAFDLRERDLDAMIKKRNEEIAGLEGRGKALEGEKAGLDQKRAELAEQLAKLEALEKASTSFNLFKSNVFKRGIKVETGVEYKSFVRHQEWVAAWCYVQVPNSQGVTISVQLARKRPGQAVMKETISAAELAQIRFTAAEMEEATGLCSFPSEGS
jgi:hypothetical protein